MNHFPGMGLQGLILKFGTAAERLSFYRRRLGETSIRGSCGFVIAPAALAAIISV
jgi:hypothetical protein